MTHTMAPYHHLIAPILDTGQKSCIARPTMLSLGTNPQERLSKLLLRLSPNTKDLLQIKLNSLHQTV